MKKLIALGVTALILSSSAVFAADSTEMSNSGERQGMQLSANDSSHRMMQKRHYSREHRMHQDDNKMMGCDCEKNRHRHHHHHEHEV